MIAPLAMLSDPNDLLLVDPSGEGISEIVVIEGAPCTFPNNMTKGEKLDRFYSNI